MLNKIINGLCIVMLLSIAVWAWADERALQQEYNVEWNMYNYIG